MKSILSAAAISVVLAGSAVAGSVSDPILDNDVITADTTQNSSASGIPLILLLAAVILAAAAD